MAKVVDGGPCVSASEAAWRTGLAPCGDSLIQQLTRQNSSALRTRAFKYPILLGMLTQTPLRVPAGWDRIAIVEFGTL